MEKRLIVLSILLAIVCGMFAPRIPVRGDSYVSVGVYYYVWYDEGYGNRHWNSTPPGQNASLLWNVVDKPILGFYSSQNDSVIRQHLDWFKNLGIDFLIISWWGPDSYEDNSTRKIFSIIKESSYPIQIVIMVEAYDATNAYNFTAIYDYIYTNYVSPYQNIYMRLEGEPLLCFYNDANMTGTDARRTDIYYSDPRFKPRIIGHNEYVDWWFGVPSGANNSRIPQASKKDQMMCVEPRYDNYYINVTPTARFDADHTEGLYDEQWNETLALANQHIINYVTICSWNEYHERSQIEPHITNNTYVLSIFSKTKSYIDQIKSTEQTPLNPFAYMIIGITIGAILTWLLFRYRGRESYIREKTAPQKPPDEEQEKGPEEDTNGSVEHPD